MTDSNETPDDQLKDTLTKYTETASRNVRARADTGKKIIEIVREYLASSPLQGEIPAWTQKETPEDRQTLLTIRKLLESSSTWREMQAVSLLAVVIRWFSFESGRPEAEILERLEALFLEGEKESLSLIQKTAQALRNTTSGDRG